MCLCLNIIYEIYVYVYRIKWQRERRKKNYICDKTLEQKRHILLQKFQDTKFSLKQLLVKYTYNIRTFLSIYIFSWVDICVVNFSTFNFILRALFKFQFQDGRRKKVTKFMFIHSEINIVIVKYIFLISIFWKFYWKVVWIWIGI